MTTSPALFTARALIDEMVRGGVSRFAVAPGSRSTALALAIAERTDVTAHVRTDERSMGFFALGLARGSGGPVALVCTSGTAAANLLPAAAEAMLGGGALLLLTADRPAELRDCAAPQTIEQTGLFGRHARWTVDVPMLDPGVAAARVLRSIASRAVATAAAGRGGPVHLNVPLREPFVDESFPRRGAFDAAARPDGRPFTAGIETCAASDAAVAALAAELAAATRGVLVCSGPELPADDVAALARALGWPLLADPLCGLRFGPHDRTLVVDAVEPLLRDDDLRARLAPDAILRFGLTPAPRSVQRWLDESWTGLHAVVCSAGHDEWPDPTRGAAAVVRAEPSVLCRALVAALGGTGTAVDPGWTRAWTTMSQAAREAADAALDADPTLFDATVLRAVVAALPDGATLAVGNSMPVRDADAFVASSPKRLRAFANRGASGIDGVLSTAAGLAVASDAPTALVVGDLSFLHDAGALVSAARERIPLLVVVVDNDGGGIFTNLPLKDALAGAGCDAMFERFFSTPHGADLGALAAAAGATVFRVDRKDALAGAVADGLDAAADGPVVVVVKTDRDAGRRAHLAAAAAARTAAAPLVPPAAASTARRTP